MKPEPDYVGILESNLHAALKPGGRQVKTARLLADILKDVYAEMDEEDVAIANAALHKLAQRQDIQVFGNLDKWRNSELARAV